MAILQVRDLPDDLHERLTRLSEAEHRSVTQQTIVVLREGLEMKKDDKSRRRAVLARLAAAPAAPRDARKIDPVMLVRRDRDR